MAEPRGRAVLTGREVGQGQLLASKELQVPRGTRDSRCHSSQLGAMRGDEATVQTVAGQMQGRGPGLC